MTETPHTWRDIANGRFDVEPKPLPSYEAPQEDELPGPAPEAPAPAPADDGRRRTWPIVVTVALLAGAAGFAGGATLDPLDRGSDREARAAELRVPRTTSTHARRRSPRTRPTWRRRARRSPSSARH